MPNLCEYEMRAVGKPKDLRKLIEYMTADYDYTKENKGLQCYHLKEIAKHDKMLEEDKIPCRHHIGYRIFEANVADEDEIDDGEVTIFGDCAWSVHSCMLEGHGTYLDNNKRKKRRHSISIIEASRMLNLDIEIFSEEPGMEFEEHFLIKKGNLEIDECVDSEQFYVEEYETKEEAEKEYGITITDEEWKEAKANEGWFKRGGVTWEYSI